MNVESSGRRPKEGISVEDRWPCNVCRNHEGCAYKSSWKPGGNNYFCPGLDAYVNIDSGKHKEMTLGEIAYTGDITRSYLGSLNESDDAIKQEHARMHDEIMAMSPRNKAEIQSKIIACLAFFGFKQKQIMDTLRVGKSRFYELYRGIQ